MLSKGVDEEASLDCVEEGGHTPGLQSPTALDVLQYRAPAASATWQDQAIAFLRDGGGGAETVTFNDLDRRARGIAAHLQSHASPGDRVLLAYPPSLDFIAGFLGRIDAGTVAVPVPAPSNSKTMLRVQLIAADTKSAPGPASRGHRGKDRRLCA
jgi:acyl-CoA synthetase (AMP-forming)/AMP-acid ligase II